MNNSYQLVVFDWEGTISDTLGFMLHLIACEAKALGFGEIDLIQARKYVDLGLIPAVKKVFPALSTIQQEQLLEAIQHSLISKSTEICLVPGVLAFIEQLTAQDIAIAIATNKGQQSLQRALLTTGLDRLFRVTRSAGPHVSAKPCPQMLEEIMGEFDVPAAHTVMIGDSTADMEMAKAIGVDALGVDFYHQNETALIASGAMAVFDDYQAIADYLKLPRG